jgi:hypothetical protein
MAITIPDAHLAIGQPVDGEILSELPLAEIASTEPGLPMLVWVDLLYKAARCSPPCLTKSPCLSPSMLSRRAT